MDLPILKKTLPKLGITSGRAASARKAEREMQALARSPTVFAGVNAVALSLATYPIRVYRGYGTGADLEPLDPEKYLWAGELLRLLQLPDPADIDALFPAHPGENLISQLVADLKLTGNGFCVVQTDDTGKVIGLQRLHPECMTLERWDGEDYWIFRSVGQYRVYPRRTVSHMKLLSWQKGGESELGTGAGTPLTPLVEAEAMALEQTAKVVSQGSVDVIVTSKSAISAAYLQNKQNREEVAAQMVESLSGGEDGKRVMVVPGDFEIRDAGLTPADVRAPELLTASRTAELSALGVVPITVGSEGGTYATAVQQYRVQAVNDEALVGVIETGLLRPLARHFASRAGGRWALRKDQVTCRIDLSGHPGYSFIRGEAIKRMQMLTQMGWTAEQAALAEGLELPKPEGKPQPQSTTPAPQDTPTALGEGTPQRERSLLEVFPGGRG